MFKMVVPVMAILAFSFQHAFSHDVWLQQKDGKLIVAYGHGEKLESYDSAKVKEVKALDCKGASVPLDIDGQQGSVSINPKGAAAVTVLFDGGYGVKTTDGWKKITKREAQDKFSIIEARKSQKYAKVLLTPCDTSSKPVGTLFEIVPEKDPFKAKPGEALTLKVFLEGKPLEGAVVKTATRDDSQPKDLPKTDKDGRVNVSIAKPGFQLITTSYGVPLKDDPDADVLSLGASLTFEAR